MLEASNIAMPLDAGLPHGKHLARAALARACRIDAGQIRNMKLLKLSVDARKKSDVHFVASYAFELVSAQAEERLLARGAAPALYLRAYEPPAPWEPPAWAGEERPVVVGAGPAGLMCAWALARAGARPIVLERGSRVEERAARVAAFNAGGPLDPECNVQFGEGGAGTFSDGKLTTNIKNPRCVDVLHAFVEAGAPEDILWRAKPHIGTDKLVEMVRGLREGIVVAGGEVHFDTRFEGVLIENGAVVGVRASRAWAADGVASGELSREQFDISARDVVLACGHSARDVFEALAGADVALERKPFSVGVRIEHPQALINRAQYGPACEHPALGAADYKLAAHTRDGHGVYTFCMCPGGEVVCAASEEGGVCVNGMSRHAREGENANAAVLVDVRDADLPGDDVFAGVRLQRAMEQTAFRVAGGTYAAPAQRVGDFLGRASASASRAFAAPEPSYARGVSWVDMHEVLPAFAADAITWALPVFDARLHGFASPDAVLTGVETRSSSPIRVVRDRESLCAFLQTPDGERVACEGLYPCGEGAGYAGGIMSAAVDGLRVAEAVAAHSTSSQSQGGLS